MGLFKSAEERRIERDIKIRQGIRRIEKSIREQGKFQDEFIKNALLIKRQAEASADFSQAMGMMASEIGKLFGETDLVQTQADWEKAMVQSQTMEERMDMFLDSVEDMAAQDVELSGASEVVTDDEIDRLIDAETEAEHQKELDKLAGLRAEIDSLKGEGEKQTQGEERDQGIKGTRDQEGDEATKGRKSRKIKKSKWRARV
jgi:hypothetical protein